jgi:hypothetical protein
MKTNQDYKEAFMASKRIIQYTAASAAAGLAALLALRAKKDKDFRRSMDQNDITQDHYVCLNRKSVAYEGGILKDMKLAAQFGSLNADLSAMAVPGRVVEMDVAIDHGAMELILPPELNVALITHCRFGKIDDRTASSQQPPLLIINARIVCGKLTLTHPDSQKDSHDQQS